MSTRIISISADGEDIVVRDPMTEKSGRISWPALSNTPPGLKYRNECISILLELVGANSVERGYNVSCDAEKLIEKATDSARLLY